MSLIVVGIVLPWLVVGLGCWLGYQLVQQNGRILVRLGLPQLDGRELSLEQYRG